MAFESDSTSSMKPIPADFPIKVGDKVTGVGVSQKRDFGFGSDHRPHMEDADAVVKSTAAPRAWLVDGGRMASLSVSKSIYSPRCVLATAYKLSDSVIVLVDEDGPDRWLLHVVAPPGGNAEATLPNLIRELGDQALRDQLEREFGDVRTLIIAQAFSEGNLLDPSET